MAVNFLYNLLPEYFKHILDFKYLMSTEEVELSEFEENMRKVYDNLYIQKADEQTITEWESLLGIICNIEDTLIYRRTRVLNMLSNVVPLTFYTLKDRLDNMLGTGTYTMNIDYEHYGIHLTCKARNDNVIPDVKNTLAFMLPAHLNCVMTFYFPVAGVAKLHTGIRITRSHKIIRTEVENYGME